MVSGAGKPLALALALLGRGQCGQSCCLLLVGNRHYSPSTVCGRSTPTCHHLEVVKSDKRKAGRGRSDKLFTSRPPRGKASVVEGQSCRFQFAANDL